MIVTHLTTALQSNASTNFVQANANFNGTNASGTIASNGISISVNAGGAGDGVNIIGVNGNSVGTNATIQFSNSNNVTFGLNGSTVTASASYPTQTAFVFSNSNGVSFGTNGSTVTATVATNYQSQGAYLTTAALSQDSSKYAGINGAITGGSLTVNTSGVSINLPAYLTTAQPVGAYLTTARASNDAIGLNSALTANGVSMTANSSGLSLNFPAFLTTAALSNHSHGNPTLNLTNLSGTTASNSAGFTLSLSAAAPGAGGGVNVAGGGVTQGTGTVNFGNSNGITFGLSNNGTMTASHNGLTTARASNDAIGLNTALTANGLSVTANSSGLSINVPAWLTTAALSNHSHGNPTLNLTNLSGTTASNSAGFTLSLSAGAGGGVTPAVSGSNGSFTFSTLSFGNLNGLSFYTSNGSLVGSYTDAGGAGGGGYSINQFENIPYVTMTNLSNMTATRFTQRPHFYPFELGGSLTHNFLMFEASRATSGSNAFTMQAALYTMANSTQLSLLASLQNVFSNTATASISGIRRFHLTGWETAGTALTPGQYVLMIMNSGTATASMNYSYRGGLTAVPPVGVILGGTDQVQTATSYLSNAAGWKNFWGNYTATTNAPPATVGKNQIQNWTSGNNLYFYMGRT